MNKPPCGLARSLRYAFNNPTRRTFATQRARIQIPASFPVIDTCPPSTCTCRSVPDGLDIDHEQPLNGTMAAYSEQVLISTGRSDWKSRIEEDEDAKLANGLKALLTRGGKYSDPFHNVMVTNSSLPRVDTSKAASAAFLFPSFKYIPNISLDGASVDRFVKAFVLPKQPHKSHELLPETQRQNFLRDASAQSAFEGVRDVEEVMILICGHGARDDRCGIMGPLLQAEFEDQLRRLKFRVNDASDAVKDKQAESSPLRRATIGQISHIGGHKYAGNVIIYIPPNLTQNALAGKGIWYGRVSTQHVEGVIQETILGGKVIKDMFRGGIERDGAIMRL